MIETDRLILRPFVDEDADGKPIYENTYQYAILKRNGINKEVIHNETMF